MRKNYYKKQSKGILDGSLTEKISDRNVPWPKCSVTEKFCDRNVLWPKCTLTEMFCDRNVPWPKCSLTEKFRDRNVPWPKRSVTEMFCDRKVLTEMSLCRNVSDRNVKQANNCVPFEYYLRNGRSLFNLKFFDVQHSHTYKAIFI